MQIAPIEKISGSKYFVRKSSGEAIRVSRTKSTDPLDRVEIKSGSLSELTIETGFIADDGNTSRPRPKRYKIRTTLKDHPDAPQSLDEKFNDFKNDLKKDAPNSRTIKFILKQLYMAFVSGEGRRPLMLQIENVTFKKNPNDFRSLYQYKAPKINDSMTWDLWQVKKEDGTYGYDYVNRVDRTNRLWGEGELVKQI